MEPRSCASILSSKDPEHGLDRTELDGFSFYFGTFVPSTLWGSDSEHPLFPRGMYAKAGKLERVGKLLLKGYSNRRVSRETGVHRDTIGKFRRALKEVYGIEFICECGRRSNHRGWCSVRFAKSPARQALMKKLHGKQRKANPERDKLIIPLVGVHTDDIDSEAEKSLRKKRFYGACHRRSETMYEWESFECTYDAYPTESYQVAAGFDSGDIFLLHEQEE